MGGATSDGVADDPPNCEVLAARRGHCEHGRDDREAGTGRE
jgi:hypothetical protein